MIPNNMEAMRQHAAKVYETADEEHPRAYAIDAVSKDGTRLFAVDIWPYAYDGIAIAEPLRGWLREHGWTFVNEEAR